MLMLEIKINLNHIILYIWKSMDYDDQKVHNLTQILSK